MNFCETFKGVKLLRRKMTSGSGKVWKSITVKKDVYTILSEGFSKTIKKER